MAAVDTVRGPVELDALGVTLMHEHVFVLTPDVMQNYGHEWWDEDVRVADAIKKLGKLKAAGVDTVFGIISVHNIPIFDAIAREGGVRLVPTRGEHGATSMADGYARATGRLAAVITSTGVGAANAAGPLLEAFVFSEVLKQGTWLDETCTVFHYRDKDQDEVDIVIENEAGMPTVNTAQENIESCQTSICARGATTRR